jgi:hypothetical protein
VLENQDNAHYRGILEYHLDDKMDTISVLLVSTQMPIRPLAQTFDFGLNVQLPGMAAVPTSRAYTLPPDHLGVHVGTSNHWPLPGVDWWGGRGHGWKFDRATGDQDEDDYNESSWDMLRLLVDGRRLIGRRSHVASVKPSAHMATGYTHNPT